MKNVWIFLLLIAISSTGVFSQTTSKPMLIGIEMPTDIPVSQAVKEAVRDMGINYINYHPSIHRPGKSLPPDVVNNAMLEFCEELNLKYAIGAQSHDPYFEGIRQAAECDAAHKQDRRFLGVVHDELVHYRVLNSYSPEVSVDNTHCKNILEGYEHTLAALTDIRKPIEQAGAPSVMASHIWPVLHHVTARAGYTVCSKICKETYSPVSLAMGLGAAIQYDQSLWADCDLWYYGAVPGHSPEEMKANLLFAYWMGVDGVYVEGAGFNLYPSGKQGMPFSLVTYVDAEHYQLTPHGEVLRWFCKEYVPKHPRNWTFRDIRPDAAIIRFNDTCHGQAYTPHFKDALYGNPAWPSDPNTQAWLGLWNVLTHGATGSDGLTFFKATQSIAQGVRPFGGPLILSEHSTPATCARHTFFVPLKGVVCYDHLVEYEKIKDIPVLYVTGVHISPETLVAVKRCVSGGALCVMWGPLAKENGFDWDGSKVTVPQGKGRFVLVDDFQSKTLHEDIKMRVGLHNEISYRFKDSRLTFRRIDDNNVDVDITPEIDPKSRK